MHLLSLPRHQIETTPSDYFGIVRTLTSRRDHSGAISSFERAFAEYVGCKHAIAISSGRLGIHLTLEQLAIEPNDEVIAPSFNLSAAIERFCQFGLVPRFCDVRPTDLTIDPVNAQRLISNRTRILLATHMYGHPVDMDEITSLAEKNNLVLIEDCAHALGTKWKNRCVGTFGKAAIFSFSVLKLVTTFGGGMIATNDDDLAGAIRLRLARLRAFQPAPVGVKKAITGTIMDVGTGRLTFSFGAWPLLRMMRILKPNVQQAMMTESPKTDRNFDPATIPPLHPFQAKLGLSQLGKAEHLIERRRRVGRWLDEQLGGIDGVDLFQPSGTGRHNGLYYGVLVDRPADLSAYLFKNGIDTETSEYQNCAELGIYGDHRTDCPVAHNIQSRILRLPNYPGMSRRDVRRISNTIRRFLKR